MKPSSSPLLERLNALVEEKYLGKHPFYIKWNDGLLTLPHLQNYACQFSHFERMLPRFLSAVHANCEIPEVRQAILQNIWDEEHGERNHLAMWLDFCEALGLEREHVMLSPVSLRMLNLIHAYTSVSRSSRWHTWQEGLAIIYAWEVQFSRLATLKMNAMVKHYDMSDGPALDFLREHGTLDVTHSVDAAEALAKYTLPEHGWRWIKNDVQEALNLWQDFLKESDTMNVPGYRGLGSV